MLHVFFFVRTCTSQRAIDQGFTRAIECRARLPADVLAPASITTSSSIASESRIRLTIMMLSGCEFHVDLEPEWRVEELKHSIRAAHPEYAVHRQRLSLMSTDDDSHVVLEDVRTLASYKIGDRAVNLFMCDLELLDEVRLESLFYSSSHCVFNRAYSTCPAAWNRPPV